MTLTDQKENAIIVGLGLKTEPITQIKESLLELEDLVYAAGANVIGSLTQVLYQWSPGTLIGKGKVQEIADVVKETGCDLVVIDHTLSGVQQRNLEDALETRVLDRNQLILDIFAKRARSHEGKLQVELAQLLDQAPRMVGAWLESHSRLGAGIGTRGPGEKALEKDRRTLRFRISQIRKELEEVKRHRRLHRERRRRNDTHRFALIGYTNTGKSTLFNRLTRSEVFVKDMPFATLDPTTRKMELDDNQTCLITDTVGFIRKLPTQLIDAFEATLEESGDAEVLIHVIDLSSPHRDMQTDAVLKLIEKFGWQNKPIIHVFNKADKAPVQEQFKVNLHPRVFTSAVDGTGIDTLKKKMIEAIGSLREEVELFLPTDQEFQLYELARQGEITLSEKGSKGTLCRVKLDPAKITAWREFRLK